MLVALTLFGALPVYRRVAIESPRSFETRADRVHLDSLAQRFVVEAAAAGAIQIIDARDETEYREKELEQRRDNHIPAADAVLFLEVTLVDSSDFAAELRVVGEERFGYRILKVDSPAIANTVAAWCRTCTSTGPRGIRSPGWPDLERRPGVHVG